MTRRLFQITSLAGAAILLHAQNPPERDPREIVRRSVAADETSERIRRNYTYRVTNRLSELNSSGTITSSQTKTEEVLYIAGVPYVHLLEKDGKPLPADEARKEQQKLDREVRKASELTEPQRRRRLDDAIAKSSKQREQLRYIPDAFTFTLERELPLNGRLTWQLHAKPRPDYRGQWAFLFHNLEGTLWIDKADYAWVKVDATTLDTISIGLFLMRLAKGSHMIFENMKVNDEVWVRKHVSLFASARIGLLKKLNADQELLFSGYRKFQSDSRIVE